MNHSLSEEKSRQDHDGARHRGLILSSVALGLGLVLFDIGAASAQFTRGPIGQGSGIYRGDGYRGGYRGGFGVPLIIPVPGPGYYEPDDEEVIYRRPRLRRAPPSSVEILDDGPVRQVRRPKRKPQREIVRAPVQKKTAKLGQKPVPPLPPVVPSAAPATPSGPTGVPPVTETRYVPNEVVFEFKPSATPASIDQVIAANRLERVASWKFKLTDSILYRYRITDGRPVHVVIAELERNPNILAAQPNYIYTLQQTAGAPDVAKAGEPVLVMKASSTGLPPQYVIDVMHVVDAHKLAKGSSILVSVIDSAIDTNHAEMTGAVSETFDPIGGVAKPDSHGTAMTGAISAHGQLTGMAPDARVLAVRAFAGKDATPEEAKAGAQGTTFHILRGLDWSYERQARVVNMSFAGPKDPALSRLIAAAKDKRMVVIAAAGNAGAASAPLYPAADPNVIAVTATDPENRLYTQSNRGKYISVAAPGVDVLVAAPGGSYDFSTGTSVATAHVSGLVALLLQKKPELDTDGVRKALMSTAIPIQSSDKGGAGLVDALAAVKSIGAN